MQRARRGGGGSPKSRRWETRSTNQRRRAKGRRISWARWGLLSHDGLWRGNGSPLFLSRILRRLRAPKKPLSFRFPFAFNFPPPPFSAAFCSAFCSAFPPPPTTKQPPPNKPVLLRASSTASSTALICKAAYAAGVGVERGLSTRFSNHHQESIRRQPRGSFCSNATLANRVTNTALSPALLGWGLRQRGVDNSVLQAPLSFICIQPTNLEYLSTDCPSKQR